MRLPIIGALTLSGLLFGQTQPTTSRTVPLYRVTVIQRQLKAVNYQYRSGPSKIDFKGTILLPDSKGEATVESKRGRTEIDASFVKLTAPQKFGREYLTYVLWAITPEGRPINLGELVPNTSDKASVKVTTEAQAFGMIVTAEPYAAVRQPSDLVVLENEVRADTYGTVKDVNAKYELLPRGHYTLDSGAPPPPDTPKVSMAEYEALSQLYQAQNAVGIARSANAEKYAPNTLAQAEQMMQSARQFYQGRSDMKRVVELAREAVQTAEDARLIAERRQQEDELAKAQSEADRAQAQVDVARAETQAAKSEAEAARVRAEMERQARERAEAQAAAARQAAAAEQATVIVQTSTDNQREAQARSMRMRLLEQLNSVLATRDTPRGLVVTLPDSSFRGEVLNEWMASRVARVAEILASHSGLQIQVEGHSDSPAGAPTAARRAELVRAALTPRLNPGVVQARGYSDARLLTSNATQEGRIQNRRVEIVISGDPIGRMPFWDRSYSLLSR